MRFQGFNIQGDATSARSLEDIVYLRVRNSLSLSLFSSWMRKDPFRESKSCIALLLYERVRREGEEGRFIASLRKEINYGTGSDDNSPWRIVKDDFPFGGGRENQWVEGVEEG